MSTKILKYLCNTGQVGHSVCVSIQREDGRWYLWSKNGEGFSSGTSDGSSGKSGEKNNLGTEGFDSPEQFMAGDRNMPKKEEGDKYMQGYVIPTTQEQDAVVESTVSEQVKSSYGFLSSNCAQAVQAGLVSVGLDPGKSTAYNPLKTMISNKAMRDAPNNIYKRIVRRNPGRVVRRKRQ